MPLMVIQRSVSRLPSLYELKPRFQSLLRPFVLRLAAAGITANQVTVTTSVAAVALGTTIFFAHRGWALLPIFLAARMALNVIDGMLAREHGQATKFGALLNEVGDVVSDAALTLPIAALPGWNPLAIATAVFFAALTEFAGLAAVTIGSARRYDGPFGKSDRAFVLGFLAAWVAIGWPIGEWLPAVACALWIALCSATVMQRLRRALG